MNTLSPRVLIVAPFTHQNGHFVTLPRDLACALAFAGVAVTLLHPRPFRTQLDWLGAPVKRLCLREQLDQTPRWWQELWVRLANSPVNQCLAWMIWKLRTQDYDLVLWTDFQAQSNIWPLRLARMLHLYRHRTAFIEHHPPDEYEGWGKWVSARINLDRLRLAGLPMFVFSRALRDQWRACLGDHGDVKYVPHGVWPRPLLDSNRTRAREAMGIPRDARVLLVFGVQAIKRKHLDTLLQAVSGFVRDKPLLLFFAGATLGNEPHLFADWQGTGVAVHIDNSFISETQVELYFSIADAAWANYRNLPGASGALFQAIGFGRLSISSPEGEIGTLTREYQLGLLLESNRVEHLRNTLNVFATMPRERQLAWERDIAAMAQRFTWPETARQVLAEVCPMTAINSATSS